MRQLNLGGLRKARVWQGELPDVHYPAGRTVDSVVEPFEGLIAESRCAAVETLIVYEPHFHNGLLGARFVPHKGMPLHITVVGSNEIGEPLADSLSTGLDELRVGLPSNLVDYVLQGALAAPQLPMFAGGEIRFDCAAYGPKGTAPIAAFNLARAVILLLTLNDEPVSAEQLRAVLLARQPL